MDTKFWTRVDGTNVVVNDLKVVYEDLNVLYDDVKVVYDTLKVFHDDAKVVFDNNVICDNGLVVICDEAGRNSFTQISHVSGIIKHTASDASDNHAHDSQVTSCNTREVPSFCRWLPSIGMVCPRLYKRVVEPAYNDVLAGYLAGGETRGWFFFRVMLLTFVSLGVGIAAKASETFWLPVRRWLRGG